MLAERYFRTAEGVNCEEEKPSCLSNMFFLWITCVDNDCYRHRTQAPNHLIMYHLPPNDTNEHHGADMLRKQAGIDSKDFTPDK